MFGSVWNFLKRHRRKFVVTGAVTGGAVLLCHYAKRKLREFQDQEAADCLIYARRQHHFDSNQRTCNMTVLSMLPNLREALMHALHTESLTTQLKTRPANRLEIWEKLKVASFTRTISAVYCCSMMVVLLRVQLNIIGGYMYIDTQAASKVNTGQQTQCIATPEVQAKYLENIHYLLGEGLSKLVRVVEEATNKALVSFTLKQPMSLLDMQEIFNRVRKQVEYRQHNGYHDACASSLTQFLMPPDDEVVQACRLTRDDMTLNRLNRETHDILESSDHHSVLTLCLDTAFTRLIDKVAEYFKPEYTDLNTNMQVFNPGLVSMPLAKVIPIMNGLVHSICADAPNQFIQELLLKEQVKDFAANVYEAFSQPVPEQTPA